MDQSGNCNRCSGVWASIFGQRECLGNDMIQIILCLHLCLARGKPTDLEAVAIRWVDDADGLKRLKLWRCREGNRFNWGGRMQKMYLWIEHRGCL